MAIVIVKVKYPPHIAEDFLKFYLSGKAPKYPDYVKRIHQLTYSDYLIKVINIYEIPDDKLYEGLKGIAPGRKVKNIEENPNISIGIYTPLSEGKIQGMQITASGRERLIFLREGDEEFEKVQRIVRGTRKLLLKIIPNRIELLDYDFAKKGYSRLQTLDL